MKGLGAGLHLRVHDGLYRLSRKGTSQNPEVYVIKVLAEHEGNSEFHPSNGEKVTTQEINFFSPTEIRPVFIEQDKGIPFVW